MSELSLIRRGAGGPKIQVLTASAYANTSFVVTGVKITPKRIFVSIIDAVPTNGYIDTYVKSGTLDFYTIEKGSKRTTMKTISLSGNTLTLTTGGAGSYQWYGTYQVVLIED
jgi:hypothetical protein